MALIILEDRYDTDKFSIDRYKEAKKKNEWCLEMYGVEHIISYVSSDRNRLICVFEAPDAEAVRQMSSKLGYSFESVWEAVAVK